MKTEIHPFRIFAKAVILFVIVNLVFAIVDLPVQRLTVYNSIVPGRVRLPFGDGEGTYNLMVDDLDIMFASHEISRPKADNEFRVVIIGDSSVWGDGVSARESLSVQWNGYGYSCGNRKLKFYNLGYPHPSVVKDLMIMQKAMDYQPDMIVWYMTLNTLTRRRFNPFLEANQSTAVNLMDAYGLTYDPKDIKTSNVVTAFYEKTLIGRRSELARLIKLQALGMIWSISGNDTSAYLPQNPDLSQDVAREQQYKLMTTESELQDAMELDALTVGHEIADSLPVLIVNEPIFIAAGMNSHIRYNEVYPRWAYDYYRKSMESEAQGNQWQYLDLWDAVPTQYFIDTAMHISPEGQRLLIEKINPVLQSIACP
jgi:hypothetical protein